MPACFWPSRARRVTLADDVRVPRTLAGFCDGLTGFSGFTYATNRFESSPVPVDRRRPGDRRIVLRVVCSLSRNDAATFPALKRTRTLWILLQHEHDSRAKARFALADRCGIVRGLCGGRIVGRRRASLCRKR